MQKETDGMVDGGGNDEEEAEEKDPAAPAAVVVEEVWSRSDPARLDVACSKWNVNQRSIVGAF